MAMIVGTASISIAPDGTPTVTGSGMAQAIAQGRLNAWFTYLKAQMGDPLPANGVAAMQGIAASETVVSPADASAIVTYITGNAAVPASGLLDSGGHACTGSAAVT